MVELGGRGGGGGGGHLASPSPHIKPYDLCDNSSSALPILPLLVLLLPSYSKISMDSIIFKCVSDIILKSVKIVTLRWALMILYDDTSYNNRDVLDLKSYLIPFTTLGRYYNKRPWNTACGPWIHARNSCKREARMIGIDTDMLIKR